MVEQIKYLWEHELVTYLLLPSSIGSVRLKRTYLSALLSHPPNGLTNICQIWMMLYFSFDNHFAHYYCNMN